MLKDFKAFILKGDVLSIAVAFIMAVAFAGVIASFTADILMPLVGAIIGKPNFDSLTPLTVGKGVITYGKFLTVLVNFIVVAAALFVIVKVAEKAMPKKEEAATTRECPMCLTEIPLAAKRCSACTSEVPAA